MARRTTNRRVFHAALFPAFPLACWWRMAVHYKHTSIRISSSRQRCQRSLQRLLGYVNTNALFFCSIGNIWLGKISPRNKRVKSYFRGGNKNSRLNRQFRQSNMLFMAGLSCRKPSLNHGLVKLRFRQHIASKQFSWDVCENITLLIFMWRNRVYVYDYAKAIIWKITCGLKTDNSMLDDSAEI